MTCFGVPCDALSKYGFKESMWASIGAMFAIGTGLKILGYLGFYIISTPKPVFIDSSETMIKKDLEGIESDDKKTVNG